MNPCKNNIAQVLTEAQVKAGFSLRESEDFIELLLDNEIVGTFTSYASAERIRYEADKWLKRGQATAELSVMRGIGAV
ncbi:MAG: hypothetical protein WC455_15830 [Dehalococcoidia bacterium]|jgi:hypothetical protein